ncbi:Uu.00g017440.m01.CDS01 [Anthostomella pinea]|uniref:Uu.00g017440.m01.CDS01 n=1 Tax=Anthostomella pinea TaxID=933095 RepID=A0AAI8YQL6_9PEZI|nr:Uu.00g017440.m01.CDS01 [Anthostomella pinea]
MDMEAKRARFEEAMQIVYGPYEADHHDPSWQPSSNPGAWAYRGRYLWTDAFGVVNFITLSREYDSKAYVYLNLAKRLAETVHSVLGRTRDGSARLPRATDAEPLNGGLRIGKMDEEGPDCDGQYHHYLTLWMFALNRLAQATEEPKWNVLAVQLAKAIHPHFMVNRHGRESMVWKMSTALSAPLMANKGHLDDVFGFVVYQLLQQTSIQFGYSAAADSLDADIEQYGGIMDGAPKSLNGDPLDLGMGLWIAHFNREAGWARELSAQGRDIAWDRFLPTSTAPVTAETRLHWPAFRECGACLGIQCYCYSTNNDDVALTEGVRGGAAGLGRQPKV